MLIGSIWESATSLCMDYILNVKPSFIVDDALLRVYFMILSIPSGSLIWGFLECLLSIYMIAIQFLLPFIAVLIMLFIMQYYQYSVNISYERYKISLDLLLLNRFYIWRDFSLNVLKKLSM